jgi:hypothetical protein
MYKQYYILNFVDKDVLTIFLSTPRYNNLIRAIGRLK